MDGVELIVCDYGMSISKTGPEVIGFQIRVVREDGLRSLPLSKQTEMRMPRMMGLPPKISGFTVMRVRSVSSIMVTSVSFYSWRIVCSPGHCRFKEACRSRYRGMLQHGSG